MMETIAMASDHAGYTLKCALKEYLNEKGYNVLDFGTDSEESCEHQGIRAALSWRPELAALAKEHNNANFLVLPARFVSYDEAIGILNAYLEAKFEGGRHQRRIDKISCR